MYSDSTYPTAVLCIIAIEFCERFSLCGIRTILSLYLRNILLFSENASTVIYHIFIMLCHIIPLIGAVCADSFFGRYRTIRNFSLIYLAGNLLMCVAAVPVLDHNPIAISIFGLLFIAAGIGGVKPCVAAFGAEQFRIPEQKALLKHFFSVFYFTINLGGFVGMIVTPLMRKVVNCFGDDTCYALGFGFSALLMVMAILLFVLGKRFYKVKIPKRNIMLEFVKCSWYAAAEKCRRRSQRHEHWLDYSKDKFDWKLLEDMKAVFAILMLFVPLPIFWSLFDQQGSRWTFQAAHMDGNVLGFHVVPDQMQVMNPAMVLALIPIFDKFLYPCFERVHFLINPLHRMVIGGMTAGLAFVAAGILELVLEKGYPELPQRNHGSVNIVNTLPCSIMIFNSFSKMELLEAGRIFKIESVCHNRTRYDLMIEAPSKCDYIEFSREFFKVSALLEELQEDTFIIAVNEKLEIQGYMIDPIDFQTSITGAPKFRIDFIKNTDVLQNVTVSLISDSGLRDVYFVGIPPKGSVVTVSPYIEISQGVYGCLISSNSNKNHFEQHFHFAIGGVYSLIIQESHGEINFVKLYTMSKPNHINIMWQIPQYFLISVAEIMFGVAGLEFSFIQAPKSMKTVTMAGWYLSTAVGNFLVIVITQIDLFKSQAYEFFLFASLIVTDMMIFIEMASRYRFGISEVERSALIVEDSDEMQLEE
ncbi:peptide transporter family 1-like [Euwallacea similis]|uniref:peptide transporter family 1-like n=1 Tax=Euwallacea similis TaxID=1736056 RepID=UPI00344BCED7